MFYYTWSQPDPLLLTSSASFLVVFWLNPTTVHVGYNQQRTLCTVAQRIGSLLNVSTTLATYVLISYCTDSYCWNLRWGCGSLPISTLKKKKKASCYPEKPFLSLISRLNGKRSLIVCPVFGCMPPKSIQPLLN